MINADTTSVSGDGSVAAADSGRQLTKAAAQQLERAVAGSPADLRAREQLVGYYYEQELLAPARDPQAFATHVAAIARDGELLWLIDHDPGLSLLGSDPLGVVPPAPDKAGYNAAAAAWTKQVATAGATAQVKGNAGVFFAQTSDPQGVALLKVAEAQDPNSPVWPDALFGIYLQQATAAAPSSPAAKAAAATALPELESAWTRSGGSDHDPRLDRLAKIAAAAGAWAKASDYANRLLRAFPADPQQSPLTYAQERHDGNMVLGEVALSRGDKAGAERYLLRAGAAGGSPQMRISGPNFSLARELLLAGSKDVVLRYFDLVAKFWSDQQLYTWRAAVVAGGVPDFRNNLWN